MAMVDAANMLTSGFFSGCPNQEIGRPFLFKGPILGTSSYFVVDSATKKTLMLNLPPSPDPHFLYNSSLYTLHHE
jgi:hypothetical protein